MDKPDISLREYMATHVFAGMLANSGNGAMAWSSIAINVYKAVDELLAQREKNPPKK